jgi:hypothetical protein
MDRADARAGIHREQRFRHHRHVEDDAVALGDAEVLQDRGERLHFAQKLRISDDALRAGDRRVVDDRRLIGAATLHVAVDRVVAGVARGAGEPAAVDAGILVEDLFRRLVPVDRLRRLAPEAFRVAHRSRVDLMIAAGAGVHHCSLKTRSCPTISASTSSSRP